MSAVFEAMLFNEETADVTFIVGGGPTARIPAHAAVLSAASDVFKQMFYGRFDREREVRVPDCQPDVFKLFIRHVYTAKMELNVETAVGAAFVAKKYMVASTYSAAVTFLTTELSKERVCELLKCLPSLGLLEEVGGTFWDTFDREAEAILLSPEFLDVNYEALREILARDTICARETTIYSQTIEWAKAELRRQSKSSSSEEQETEVADEGVRELLGEAIRLIRFPAMTIKEFSQGPAKSGVLTDEEKVAIFMHLTTATQTALFNAKPRGASRMLVCRACGKLDAANSTKICTHCKYDQASDVRRMTLQVPFTTIVRGPQQVEISVSNYLRNSASRGVTVHQPAPSSGYYPVCPLCGYANTSGTHKCSQCHYEQTADSRQLKVRVKRCQHYQPSQELMITANVQNYLNPAQAFRNSSASQPIQGSCESCASNGRTYNYSYNY